MDSLFVSRSSSSYDWEFRYTGRREDLETGLYYFRARIYSAQLGRFVGEIHLASWMGCHSIEPTSCRVALILGDIRFKHFPLSHLDPSFPSLLLRFTFLLLPVAVLRYLLRHLDQRPHRHPNQRRSRSRSLLRSPSHFVGPSHPTIVKKNGVMRSALGHRPSHRRRSRKIF